MTHKRPIILLLALTVIAIAGCSHKEAAAPAAPNTPSAPHASDTADVANMMKQSQQHSGG